MGTITKQDAAILFAYSFKLVDKEGKEYEIRGVEQSSKGGKLMLADNKSNAWTTTELSQIGTDYWILKRPYSQLTIPIGDDEIIVYNKLWNRSKNDFDEYGEKASFNMWAYEDISTLNKYHFINLPEGTYREMD